jgi:hypothetical protein
LPVARQQWEFRFSIHKRAFHPIHWLYAIMPEEIKLVRDAAQ